MRLRYKYPLRYKYLWGCSNEKVLESGFHSFEELIGAVSDSVVFWWVGGQLYLSSSTKMRVYWIEE